MEPATIASALMVFPGDLPLAAALAVIIYAGHEFFWKLRSLRDVAVSLVRRIAYVLVFAVGLFIVRLAGIAMGVGLTYVISG